MNKLTGNKILGFMIAAALVFAAIGGFVVYKRSQNPKQENQQTTQEQTTPTPEPLPEQTPSASDWKTYTNDKYGFSLQYPPNFKVGSVSENSALGTYQDPVKGFHVGPLVLVVLRSNDLKQQGQDYFTAVNLEASAPPQNSMEGPTISCKSDKISNPTVTIKSVSCVGEGGPARYAYITGTSYDIFVDGYSRGYDGSDNGEFTLDTDYVKLLSTFRFNTATTQATPPPASTPTVEKFAISADDSVATPSSITVKKGNLVQITFNVASSNVYYGGLDFKSSVVNSGTIYAGQSKTVSFTADQSFQFTPYWPSSQVAKNYKVSVVVQ